MLIQPDSEKKLRIGIDVSILQGYSAQRGMGRYTLQQLVSTLDQDNRNTYFLFYQPAQDTHWIPKDLQNRPNVRFVALDFPEAGLLFRIPEIDEVKAYTVAMQKFIQPFELDVFHLTASDDFSMVHTPRDWLVCPLVMTVYDLIPYFQPEVHLQNTQRKIIYEAGLSLLARSHHIITISDAVKSDLVDTLALPADRITVAPPFASSRFQPQDERKEHPSPLLDKLALKKPYIYAISALGPHKNVAGLLRAFAELRRQGHTEVSLALSVFCKREDVPQELLDLVNSLGINSSVVWTGFLSDKEILQMTQEAVAYAHVSLFEGFGIPILEAMQCGIPVVTSDRGSMREIAQDAALLVDPEQPADIARALAQIVQSETLRDDLRSRGLERARLYTPERLGHATLQAYYAASESPRARIAMWTPLPPMPTGISDYSVDLVEYLRRYIAVDAFSEEGVTPGFTEGTDIHIRSYKSADDHPSDTEYATHIYHVGNNPLHTTILNRSLSQPGIIVLHDLSLYGLYARLFVEDRDTLMREIRYSEGDAIADNFSTIEQQWAQSFDHMDLLKVLMTRRVVENSLGVIVHSQYGHTVLQERYPDIPAYRIASGTDILPPADADVRRRYGWRPEQLVFGAFGGIGPIKRLHIVLEAFARLVQDHPSARLVIVGRESDDLAYVQRIRGLIRDSHLAQKVVFAGEVSAQEFEDLLKSVDVVINLRWPTAGETSATFMRALGAGKLIICSDVPQVQEFPSDFCHRIPLGEHEIPTLFKVFSEIASDVNAARRTGQLARQYAQQHAAWDIVAEQYWTVILQTSCDRHLDLASAAVPGVNLVGDLHGDMGLSQACRAIAEAMQAAMIPLTYNEVVFDPSARHTEFEEPPGGFDHHINLFQLNAPQLPLATRTYGPEVFGRHYNIGFWFYEIAHVPDQWKQAAAVLDELWVASHYVKDIFDPLLPIPVKVIPLSVQFDLPSDTNLPESGLPTGRFMFLFTFSMSAGSARKNPFGVIDAFNRAFGNRTDGPVLILKAQGAQLFPELRDALRDAATQNGNIFLITEDWSREDTLALLSACDCFVSLHRAEGFGLAIAEAMSLGKPVIATGWSSNMDFMTPENSYPVRFDLVPISNDHHSYQEINKLLYPVSSASWADPDINHAAELMRYVYEHPAEAQLQGQRAARHIAEYFSHRAVGRAIRERLMQIQRIEQHKRGERTIRSIPRKRGADPHSLQEAYRQWNTIRTRQDRISDLPRIISWLPPLKYMYRVLSRIAHVGKVWNAQAIFYRELLQFDQQVEIRLVQLEQIEARMNQLNQTLADQMKERLDEIERRLPPDARPTPQAEAQASGEARATTQLDVASLVALIAELERKITHLAAASVEISSTPQVPDEVLAPLTNYFGHRLSGAEIPEAVYHVVIGSQSNDAGLLEQPLQRLSRGSILVLILLDGASPMGEWTGLELRFWQQVTGNSGTATIFVLKKLSD